MVLSMTCYSAPFDNPTEDSIGEKFLREPGKGAIAVFAASWRNAPSPRLQPSSVIDELLKPGATIGEAIVRAKKQSNDRTLVEMYNLLGDPAVVLERPRDEARVAFDDRSLESRRRMSISARRASAATSPSTGSTRTAPSSHRRPYAMNKPRFRLAVPSLPAASRPATCASTRPRRRPDAMSSAAIDLTPPKPAQPLRDTCSRRGGTKSDHAPAYKPRVRQRRHDRAVSASTNRATCTPPSAERRRRPRAERADTVRALFALARPEQWIKNGFVLLPLIFGQAAGDPRPLRGAFLATLAFCLLSSAVYAGNDVVDRRTRPRPPDQACTRPVASGAVNAGGGAGVRRRAGGLRARTRRARRRHPARSRRSRPISRCSSPTRSR